MKVAVITRHAIANYGSLLQAMATQKVVEDLGHNCEIIDYVREDESYKEREKTLLKRKPEWNNNPLKRFVYLAVRQPESIVAGKRFEKAQKKYLKLTKRYTKPEQLLEDKPDADVYMTGSDQVWGPVENGTYDSSYCLSFTSDKDKKISYAASFGHTDMTTENIVFFSKWLSRYNQISVREDSALEIVRSMGLDAKQVIDPTLLLDSAYWNKFTTDMWGGYILIYQLHNDERLGRYAKAIADAQGVPLIRISSTLHQINREGKLVWCPEPGVFLSYIKYAKCMVTDSFHGTAFAINFNTPFIEVLPNNNTGTRNTSILNTFGLADRILKDDDLSLALKDIDYERVNRILSEKRNESLEILKRMIEQ